MSPPLLRLQNISKQFPGVRALDRVDLTIAAGEIHGLVGENGSGKSTLIQIMAGAERAEAGGRVELDGMPVVHWDAHQSVRRGVEVIYQDLSLFPNLRVAENIALGQLVAERAALFRRSRARALGERALAEMRASLDLDARAGTLPLAEQQLVAIARALTRNVRLLIMDEPTSSLTRREIESLFSVVRRLQARGIAIVFVSHKLEEILELAHRVSVLRDGRLQGTFPCPGLTAERLAALMSGRAAEPARRVYRPAVREPLLEIQGWSKAGQFEDVRFRLFPGEVLGIAGRLGSGRAELALSLFGLNPPDRGQLRIGGRPQVIRHVRDANRLGIGLVPENRAVQGLVMAHSVGRNALITILDRLRGALGLLRRGRVRKTMSQVARAVGLRDSWLDRPAETLSGGNQQRLVLAKWLAARPKVLILHGPTVGIDIAAKAAIHELIATLASEGMSLLLISDEIHELLTRCHRILLMAGGRVTHEWAAADVSESDIRSRLLDA